MIIQMKRRYFLKRVALAATMLLFLSEASIANVVIDWNAIAAEAPPPRAISDQVDT